MANAMVMTGKKEIAKCLECSEMATLQHGYEIDAWGKRCPDRPCHLWICPNCGENIYMVAYDCPDCKPKE